MYDFSPFVQALLVLFLSPPVLYPFSLTLFCLLVFPLLILSLLSSSLPASPSLSSDFCLLSSPLLPSTFLFSPYPSILFFVSTIQLSPSSALRLAPQQCSFFLSPPTLSSSILCDCDRM